jgi:hypothetical protein
MPSPAGGCNKQSITERLSEAGSMVADSTSPSLSTLAFKVLEKYLSTASHKWRYWKSSRNI